MRHRITFFVLGCLVLLLGLFLWHLSIVERETQIVFLNVGQGDAILISQGSHQIVIDGGRSGKELLARLGRHIPFWDRKIETIIATHPDADHIGGFPTLLRNYRVDHILTTGAESQTEIFWLFQWSIERYARKVPALVYRGGEITFPYGGTLRIEYPLAPLSKEGGDTNEGSIVARFSYGETSFLFTGDLPREEVVLPDETPVTVLKVAHHGSKYSTSEAFLQKIRPKEAVISVGENSYGHPDPGVLERLKRAGVRLHRTDEEGDIRYRCFRDFDRCEFVP